MKRNHHEWTKRTAEGRRVFQAWTERGEWVIQSALETRGRAGRRRSGEGGSEMRWEREAPASLDDLRLFREVLWNKYQRGRLAYKLVERVDAMIEEREEEGEEASGCLVREEPEADVDPDGGDR